ncbi:MAG: glycosyltransferase family 2 protein [Desulfobaccales bacterium]
MEVDLTDGKKARLPRATLATLDQALKILVPLMLLIFSVICIKVGSLSGYLRLFSPNSYSSPLVALGASYTLAFLALQAVRTVLWWRYRPYPVPSGPLPRVTVIIPAYNEGAMVGKAIRSVVSSDYPPGCLEIICIDDGSRDDTWDYIDRSQKAWPHLIKAIRFPKNLGKREALYAGFTQGRGEYFVTLDSDSVIDPGTLKQIIAPLLQDPEVGAVAGNVKVYNRTANFITRMLWVRFILSFDFLRASQSMYGFVFCTPGALSAYRRQSIFPILEKWRRQKFLGVNCTIGEDRAFTNFVLRQGFRTVYQRSAVVHTLVPETYRSLCRMLLRWDRSNFRESLIQLSYMFTRYRNKQRLMPILDFFIRELEFPFFFFFLPLLIFNVLNHPMVLLKFLSGMGLVSFFLTFYYIQQERDMDFIYGVLYSYYAILLLRWIKPFAFFTLRNGRWLTR